jgi:Ca2+:H+ antiporter
MDDQALDTPGKRPVIIGVVFVLVLVAGMLDTLDATPVATFVAATAALAGLAWLVSIATESLGSYAGPALTGVLQSAFGNVPEIFVVLFAIADGQLVVAQTAIVGSILANALLALGVVLVVGSRASSDGVMRFHRRLAGDTSTLLILAIGLIVLLDLASGSVSPRRLHAVALSTVGAVALLLVFGVWLVGYLRGGATDGRPEAQPSPRTGSELPLRAALALLAAGGVASGFVADWFIGALRPSLDTLHLSPEFAGIVIVGIAGNAVENATGVVLAAKGRSDLAVSVVINSVNQIAVFVFPVLVLASLLFDAHLTFELAPVYSGALALTAVAMWQIAGDGEAFLFEGFALIALYVIVAVFAYLR